MFTEAMAWTTAVVITAHMLPLLPQVITTHMLPFLSGKCSPEIPAYLRRSSHRISHSLGTFERLQEMENDKGTAAKTARLLYFCFTYCYPQ